MVITSVVVSIAYYSWFLIGNQFTKYHRRSMEIQNFYLLSDIWQKDFERADAVRDSIDNRHFLFNDSGTSIRYSIDSNTIVREANGSIDSFPIHPGTPVVTLLNDSLPLIRAITIPVFLNGD